MHNKYFCCGFLPVALLAGAVAYFSVAGVSTAGAKGTASQASVDSSVGGCSCCVDCTNLDCACELLNCQCDQGEACKCDSSVSVVSTVAAKVQPCDCCSNCTNPDCPCEAVGCQCDAGGQCACGSCCSSASEADATAAAAKPAGSCCSGGCCSK